MGSNKQQTGTRTIVTTCLKPRSTRGERPVSGRHQVQYSPILSFCWACFPEAGFNTQAHAWMCCVPHPPLQEFLQDRQKVAAFSNFVGPLVRAADAVAGEAVGMRVDVQLESGQEAVGLFIHKFCSEVAGSATAAFAEAVLSGETAPGVWYPEEQGCLGSGRARLRLMHRAAQGYSKPCYRFELNKASWQLDTDPKYLVMGMYL
jgi:hypothetical protein